VAQRRIGFTVSHYYNLLICVKEYNKSYCGKEILDNKTKEEKKIKKEKEKSS
jgi:hypothetical protein